MKKPMSQAKRSAIAKKAAAAAWATMRSKGYQSAAKKSPVAVKAFLAARRKAA
jgi:hypothetical protein